MAYEYEVDFLWKGDVRVEQERMMDWLETHGEDASCGFVTHGKDSAHGTGDVILDSIERVYFLEHDLGVTVTQVKRIDLDELLGVPEPDAEHV